MWKTLQIHLIAFEKLYQFFVHSFILKNTAQHRNKADIKMVISNAFFVYYRK